MRFAFAVIVIALCAWGCTSARSPIEASLRKSLGQKITLVGTADLAPGGAAIWTEEYHVLIAGLDSWPNDTVGKKIEIIGTLDSVDRLNDVMRTSYKKAPLLIKVSHVHWKEITQIKEAEPVATAQRL